MWFLIWFLHSFEQWIVSWLKYHVISLGLRAVHSGLPHNTAILNFSFVLYSAQVASATYLPWNVIHTCKLFWSYCIIISCYYGLLWTGFELLVGCMHNGNSPKLYLSTSMWSQWLDGPNHVQATWYTSAVAMGMITASDFCTQSLCLVQAMQ